MKTKKTNVKQHPPSTPAAGSAPEEKITIDDLRIEAAIILEQATEARDRARAALNDIELIATPGRGPAYLHGKGMGAKLDEICRIAHQALARQNAKGQP